MKYKSGKAIKHEFIDSHNTQTDDEFIVICGLDSALANDILNVRSAIANLGRVDPTFIRAEYLFDAEMINFDFWGSLDSIVLVSELEKYLGVQITDEMAIKIPNPENTPGLTVAAFVGVVLDVTGKKG